MQQNFYDSLASHYHLIFEDWNASIQRQGNILSALLGSPQDAGKILDCACGIGTQTFALAERGYSIQGTDLSAGEIERAQLEARERKLNIDFRVDDMRNLATAQDGEFDTILCMDNAIPHLDSDDDISLALNAMRRALRAGGRVLISIRDYGPLMSERCTSMPPVFYQDGARRRIVHQIWDWRDERRYTVHLFVTREIEEGGWDTRHFVGSYRAITPIELSDALRKNGFTSVEILQPSETQFYQPIIRAIAS